MQTDVYNCTAYKLGLLTLTTSVSHHLHGRGCLYIWSGHLVCHTCDNIRGPAES